MKPVNGGGLKQVGFKCDDPEFNWNGIEYKASLVCRAIVYNPVKYPNKIHGSETATIVFKNTAHTGLITLEKDLFGSYVSIWLTYLISPQGRDDITFTGTDTVYIRQDHKDVIFDVGTNFLLIGADIKAGITIVKLAKNGEVISALKNFWPYVVSSFRWGWSEINN